MEALVSQTALSPSLSQLACRELNSSRSTVPALGSSSELRQTLSSEFPDLSYMVLLLSCSEIQMHFLCCAARRIVNALDQAAWIQGHAGKLGILLTSRNI